MKLVKIIVSIVSLMNFTFAAAHPDPIILSYEESQKADLQFVYDHQTDFNSCSILQRMQRFWGFTDRKNDYYIRFADGREERRQKKDKRSNVEVFKDALGKGIVEIYFTRSAQDFVDEVVCQTALKTYEKINQTWSFLSEIGGFHFPDSCWQIIDYLVSNFKYRGPEFIPTAGISYSKALDDLLEFPVKAECRIAFSFVKLMCFRALMGDERFNRFEELTREINQSEGINVFSYFAEGYVGAQLPLNMISAGMFGYITNVPSYPYYKPSGYYRGENLVCVGTDLFIGFKMPVKTRNEILHSLRDAFCSSEGLSSEGLRAQHQIIAKKYNDDFDIFRRECEEYERNHPRKPMAMCFDVERLFTHYQQMTKVIDVDCGKFPGVRVKVVKRDVIN